MHKTIFPSLKRLQLRPFEFRAEYKGVIVVPQMAINMAPISTRSTHVMLLYAARNSNSVRVPVILRRNNSVWETIQVLEEWIGYSIQNWIMFKQSCVLLCIFVHQYGFALGPKRSKHFGDNFSKNSSNQGVDWVVLLKTRFIWQTRPISKNSWNHCRSFVIWSRPKSSILPYVCRHPWHF